jgi:hypothetical protein
MQVQLRTLAPSSHTALLQATLAAWVWESFSTLALRCEPALPHNSVCHFPQQF